MHSSENLHLIICNKEPPTGGALFSGERSEEALQKGQEGYRPHSAA